MCGCFKGTVRNLCHFKQCLFCPQLSVGIRQRIAFYEGQESFRKVQQKAEAITEVVLDLTMHVKVTSQVEQIFCMGQSVVKTQCPEAMVWYG